MTFQTYYSPIGPLLLVSDGQHLIKIEINPQNTTQEASRTDPVLEATRNWLDRYFSGCDRNCSDLPLCPIGTPFQLRVWQHILSVPYGHTITYGEIATRISKELGIEKMSAQAVGRAVGANPLPIVIPCHRVLGTNGKLVGYLGGLTRKIYLLELEQANYKK